MTEITQQKIRLAFEETADALQLFHFIRDDKIVTTERVAQIRRLLCAVTSKLVAVESELALAEELERSK